MLNSYTLLEAMNGIHEKQITMALDFLGYGNEEQPRSHHSVWRTVLIAAVITMLLGAVAYAVYYSIHQQRQMEIRQDMQIDANQVQDYVEYAVPTDDPQLGKTEMTVLSAINNGAFEELYVNISPVSREEIAAYVAPVDTDFGTMQNHFCVSTDHGLSWMSAFIRIRDWTFTEEEMHEVALPEGGTNYRPTAEAMLSKYLSQSYDEYTQTLTLQLSIPVSDIAKGDTIDFALSSFWLKYGKDGSYLGQELNKEYGSQMISVTAYTPISVTFPEPIEFKNEVTGEPGAFIGADISATRIVWKIQMDEAERLMCPPESVDQEEYFPWQASWINSFGSYECSASLLLQDGAQIALTGSAASYYEDGLICDPCSYPENATVDVSAIKKIMVCGNAISLDECNVQENKSFD